MHDTHVPEVCVHELFEAQVDRTPDAIAMTFASEQLTYRELDARANQLARRLRTLGVGPDVLVGICTERSLDMVIALLATSKAGGAYVPLDPAYPKDRIAYMLEDSGTSVLVSQRGIVERGIARHPRTVYLDEIAHEDAARLASTTRPANLAYVIYTSGSTGRPKGVMIAQRALVNFLVSMQKQPGLTRDDVLGAVTSLSFDISALEIYLPLVTGARLVLFSREDASDGQVLRKQLATNRVSVLQATPSTFRLLLDAGFRDRAMRVLCGGEALPGPLATAIAERVGTCWNMYGPTETTIWSTLHRVEPGGAPPIGRPIDNTSVCVLDEQLASVKTGDIGELYIGGDGLARGYHGRPGLTAERFVPDPYGRPGSRLYRTGDAVRWRDDETLEYVGRLDHQVKVRGFRIELGEIEAVLGRSVREVIVAARDDGHGAKRLVAYLVGTDRPPIASLRAALAVTLPEYMIPSAYVWLDAMPRMPNGKIDRGALPEPDAAAYASAEYEAPESEAECGLAGIWRELLGDVRVGRLDDFFDLGGHSLLAMQMVERIRRRFRQEVPLRQIFRSSTLVEIARTIDEGATAAGLDVQPRSTDRRRCRAYAHQELAWQLWRAQPSNFFTNMTVYLRARSGGREHFARVLRALVERHSVLRSRFEEIDGVLMTEVCDLDRDPPIDAYDLAALSPDEAAAESSALLLAFRVRPFDLERGYPIRGAIVALPDRTSVVAVTVHHIAFDAQSARIFYGELVHLWNAYVDGETDGFGPRPLQYIDFLEYVERQLALPPMQRERAYWRGQLCGAEVAKLPFDEPPRVPARPGDVWARRAGSVVGAIEPALADAVGAIARELRATRYAAFLAGFAAALHASTSQDDIALHSSLMQRSRPELESIIGLMSNPLVMRLRLHDGITYRELVNQARDVQLAAYEHGVVPLRREIPPELLRINFNYTLTRDSSASSGAHVEHYTPPLDLGAVEMFMPYDLILALDDRERTARLLLQFNADVASAEHARAFLRRYIETLESLCARPDASLREVLGGKPERRKRPLVPVLRGVALEPSFAQESMWLLQQIDPASNAYNVSVAYRLRGRLDVEALRRAIEHVVERHEALRSVFPDATSPLLEIAAPERWSLSVDDLSGLDPVAAEREFVTEHTRAPFDLARGPLVRTRLARLRDDVHVLLLVMHHTVVDGLSMLVLWRDLWSAYQALPLPVLAVQFADYAAWERRRLRGSELERQLRAWTKRLRGAPALPLPYRVGAPAMLGTRAGTFTVDIGAEWAALRIQAQASRTTPFVALLACLRAVLARQTGESDICIGVPVGNRNHPAANDLVGCFVNTIVTRARVDLDRSFADLLTAQRTAMLDALGDQQTPLHAVLRALGVSMRRGGRTPLYQVMFQFDTIRIASDEQSELVAEPIPLPEGAPQVELMLRVFEHEHGAHASFIYSEDLFDAAVVERVATDYAALVERLARAPHEPIGA